MADASADASATARALAFVNAAEFETLYRRTHETCAALAHKFHIAATLMLEGTAPRSFIMVLVDDRILFSDLAAAPAQIKLACATEAAVCIPAALDSAELRAELRLGEFLDACDATHVPFIFIVHSAKYFYITFPIKARVDKCKIERACCAAQCPATDAHASAPAQRMQCSGCRGAFYCSRECQLRDWPRHRAACKSAEYYGPEKSKEFLAQ